MHAPTPDEKVAVLDETRASLTEFLASTADGTFYPGHACMLVRMNGRKYLFDPVMQRPLLLESWLYFPPQVMDPRLLDVDGVFISHFHEDHYDPRFLRQLPPGTPIYIAEERPMFEGWLRELGLVVKTLPPRRLVEVSPGVSVYSMPSEYNKIDSSFLLKGGDLCVYQGNDNFLTAETLVEARRAVGPVDHAFVPYAYIWWYPFRLGSIDAETRHREGQRMVTKYLDLGLEHATILGSPIVVPCGGNLVYYDSVDSDINQAVYTPYDFKDYTAKHRPDLAERIMPLVAGDYLLKEDGVDRAVWSPSTTAIYKEKLAAFLASWAAQVEPAAAARPRLTLENLAFLERRLARTEVLPLDYVLVFLCSDDPTNGFQVDLKAKTIALRTDVPSDGRAWIRFEMQAVALDAWLSEQIIFEVVLESARFTIYRFPEVHDPKIWEMVRLYF
jgi:hypothetical protein